MLRTKNLGDFYWNEKIEINDLEVEACDLRFNSPKGIKILKKEQLCPCGNYGRRIIFRYKGEVYSFNYLTGYPCQC